MAPNRFVSLLPCAVLLAVPGRSIAFPDGAPWEAAEEQGCVQCHFDAPIVQNSSAIEIEGLPKRITSGTRYALTVRLSVEEMVRAGFLLSAWQAEREAAGRFAATNERAVAQRAQARSTEAGAALNAPAMAEWKVDWVAPENPAGPILFELWTNAANNDQSPFGDDTHHRTWQISTE